MGYSKEHMERARRIARRTEGLFRDAATPQQLELWGRSQSSWRVERAQTMARFKRAKRSRKAEALRSVALDAQRTINAMNDARKLRQECLEVAAHEEVWCTMDEGVQARFMAIANAQVERDPYITCAEAFRVAWEEMLR